tara:strand:+ start:120 stop:881 length:762 start_codon:yes stop_codon:yes gene_type:complete
MNRNKMNIKEIEPENKIVLSKFNFSCDAIDDSIPKPLPQMLNFFLLICGRPGSGKTSLILNLIAKRGKLYNKKFDRIFVFSPSLMTMASNPFEELPEEQTFTSLDYGELETTLDLIKDTGEKILFIMDDVVNDMKKMEIQTTISKMLMNRRHLAGAGGSCSFIITSQVYNKIPAPIRKTASHIIIYHTKNKKELDTIYDELIIIPIKDFYEILKYCFDKKHNFVYIDVNKSYDKMFHKCFNQLEFSSNNETGL